MTRAALAAGARRATWPVVVAAVAAGALFLALFPTRTYLDQRRDLDATAERLQVLRQENAKLGARVRSLNTDAEIERLAREQYGLVRPGEEAYAILPAPEPPAAGPQPAPRAPRAPFWTRLIEHLRFWS